MASDKLFEDGCVRCQGSEWRDDINTKVNAVFQNDQNRNDTGKLIVFQHSESQAGASEQKPKTVYTVLTCRLQERSSGLFIT